MKAKDLTLPPDLIHRQIADVSSSLRPRYRNLLPPCNQGCPAGENIQNWLVLVQENQHKLAWEKLVEVNPMPAIHGRVCYHPCETQCNRNEVDQPVRIHAVERFLGDLAIEKKWPYPLPHGPSGRRILIIGSGPAGLSAAYHLATKGHSIEIYEAADQPGGMMRYGIPSYRLPRSILDGEISRLEGMGIKIHLNRRVNDVQREKEQGLFDGVFVAIGAHIGTNIDIPAQDASVILDAVTFLKNVEQGEPPLLGRRVAIYGGGNTAMDSARTAKRLGAEEAFIIYRRDREHMPAHAIEAIEAEEEGITINWLRTIKGVEEDSIQVEKMALDEQGRPQPTGEYETLAADSLILALGQNIEADLLNNIEKVHLKADGSVEIDPQFMTGSNGIFAGGDMTPGVRSVTYATGHGRKAAQHIHAWLNSRQWVKQPSPEVVNFEHLHLWYKTEAPSRKQESLESEERVDNFEEVLKGFDASKARYEAHRCFSCGNCFECDGCYGACPENAISILGDGRGYRIDYERCSGCGACVAQCPTYAISFTPTNNNDGGSE